MWVVRDSGTIYAGIDGRRVVRLIAHTHHTQCKITASGRHAPLVNVRRSIGASAGNGVTKKTACIKSPSGVVAYINYALVIPVDHIESMRVRRPSGIKTRRLKTRTHSGPQRSGRETGCNSDERHRVPLCSGARTQARTRTRRSFSILGVRDCNHTRVRA